MRLGASAGGWTVVAVHDSKESWVRFRDEILIPRMQAGHQRRVQDATSGDGNPVTTAIVTACLGACRLTVSIWRPPP